MRLISPPGQTWLMRDREIEITVTLAYAGPR